MKIYLGADHGGFELKEKFKEYLSNNDNYELEDCGAASFVADDDYPDFAFVVAEKVASDQQSLGVLFCRSGSGMVIAANKVKEIRAVEIYDQQIAAHAKSHNQANVIAFSGDYLSAEQMFALFEIFIKEAINQDERHQRRLQKINNYENRI